MPKPSRNKTSTAPSGCTNDQESRSKLMLVGKLLASVALAAGLSLGYLQLRRFVEHRYAFASTPPQVQISNRPAWMSDLIYQQVLDAVSPVSSHSAFDHQLLVDRVDLLRSSPWVRQVRQVRRRHDGQPGGLLEIDCEWRTPAALVQYRDGYWLVDSQGVTLPERYTAEHLPRLVRAADGKVNLRIIEGVAEPAPAPGSVWAGDDLRAGLAMTALLAGHAWADEIERVNVRNFADRVRRGAAQITLITRHNTELRWGRPLDAEDFYVEASPTEKIARLQHIFHTYGRIDAGAAWVELRFDKVEVPNAPR